MGRKDELTNATVGAFEESTGEPPNDYEYATIKTLAQEYVSDEEDKQN
jgi:hypothetical protein